MTNERRISMDSGNSSEGYDCERCVARENIPSNDALRTTRAFVRAAANEISFQGSAVKGAVQITDRKST